MTEDERTNREKDKMIRKIIRKAREIVATDPEAGRVRIVRKVGICCGNCEYHVMRNHKIRCNNPDCNRCGIVTKAIGGKTCEDWKERKYYL